MWGRVEGIQRMTVDRAGGFTNDAYLKAGVFTRASTQKTQQEAIDKLIEDLEIDVAQKNQQVSGALDAEDVAANKELTNARRGLMGARVEPGDSILVPEKLLQVRFMKDVKDITQILYQIAVTAGVLILAF